MVTSGAERSRHLDRLRTDLALGHPGFEETAIDIEFLRISDNCSRVFHRCGTPFFRDEGSRSSRAPGRWILPAAGFPGQGRPSIVWISRNPTGPLP